MAVKVHRYLRRKVAADPTSPMVYHLKQVPGTSQTHTIENLADIIEEKSSLTAGDVIHVTNALVRELKKVLLRGDRVKINGFGIFSLTFNATEVETEKECTVKTINKVNIRFRTDNALRLANESTSDTHGSNNVKFDIAAHAGGNTKKREKTEALVFGGTTEGRKAVAVCDEAAKPYHYSTKGNGQKVDSAHGIPLTGGLEEKEMTAFCKEKNIRLIIDAGHPFAEVLHRNIAAASDTLSIPVIRFERDYPPHDSGFNEKIKVADRLNSTVLVVKRPVLSASFIPVYGENGLRKQIEKLFPCFFDLKTGYTTGACAAAATKAALIALLTREEQKEVRITLPNGEGVLLPVQLPAVCLITLKRSGR